MGWTTNREVQCGCGWEGTDAEVVGVVHWNTRPSAVGPGGKLMMLSSPQWVGYICPICGVDVTRQYIEQGFRLKIVDCFSPDAWKRYADKPLNAEYFKTLYLAMDEEVNDDRRRRKHPNPDPNHGGPRERRQLRDMREKRLRSPCGGRGNR